MKKLLLISLALLAAAALAAQPWQQDNSMFNPSGIPSFTFSQPRFADLDADGDFDFILGGSNNPPLYIKNTGSPASPHFSLGENITAGISDLNAEVAVCADIDADGYLDLVTGGFTGLHLYLNTGTPSAPIFVWQPGFFSALAVGNYPVPDLADVDGDGDPDLVVGLSEDGAVLLFTNIGTPAQAQFSGSAMQTIGDVGLYAYPIFCDLDADGDQDILCGRDGHGFIYYQNNGSPANPLWQDNSALFAGLGNASYWNSPDLVDLTGDGLADLVFGTANGPLLYYINTGTHANPAWQANTSLFGGVLDVGAASSPVFYDFDGDGDLDMISGSQMGDIKYFENTGTPYSPAWTENNAYFASIDHSIYSSAAIGDVNADGLPDAIIGDLSGNLYFHKNTGFGFIEEAGVLPPISLGGWSVPRLADMDGDGDLDLIVGNEAGNFYYYRNQGNQQQPAWVQISGFFGSIDVGSNCSLSLGDIDGDGDLDIVAGNIQGNLKCYLQGPLSWTLNSVIFAGISTGQNAAPALADIDHDGDLDLTIGDYDGTFSFYRNQLYSGTTLNPPQNLQLVLGGIVWNPPQPGSSSPFEAYQVYLNGEFLGESSLGSWIFANLTEGQEYTALVTAQYIAGESAPVSITWTQNIHNSPLDPGYEPCPGGLRLFWSPPQGSTVPLVGYSVYLDSAPVGTTVEQEFILTDLLPGQTYQAGIAAFYTDGYESETTLLDIVYTGNDDLTVPILSLQIHPNPFKSSTTLSFSVKGSIASLEIYNLKGQRVRAWDGLAPGLHSIYWDGHDANGKVVGSGIYLCRLKSSQGVLTRRMVLTN